MANGDVHILDERGAPLCGAGGPLHGFSNSSPPCAHCRDEQDRRVEATRRIAQNAARVPSGATISRPPIRRVLPSLVRRFRVEIPELSRDPALRCFEPFADALRYALRSLGHTITTNPNDGGRPILLGVTERSPEPPKDAILYNAEQVAARNVFHWRDVRYCRTRVVWDFAETHLAWWRTQGVERVVPCPVGYAPQQGAPERRERTTDILFYGTMNARRAEALEDLKRAGLSVRRLSGVYGRDLIDAILSAKIVLNLHYYEGATFEIFRASQLFALGACVVTEGEGSDPVLERIADRCAVVAQRADLADVCAALLEEPARRAAIGQRACEEWRRNDFVGIVAQAIAETDRVEGRRT